MKLFITWMIISTSFAGFIANKGPLFSYPEKKDASYDQDDLIRDYLIFKVQSLNRDLEKIRFYKSEGERFLRDEKLGRRVFKLPKHHHDLDYDAFPFTYGTTGQYSQYPFMKILYGLCMGFTTGLRKFHYLTYFNDEVEAPYDEFKQPEKWLNYYKSKLDSIMRGEVTIVNGMADLYELTGGDVFGSNDSLRKELQTYAMRHLTDQWAINNLSSRGLFYISGQFTGPENKSEVEAFRNKILDFHKRNFEPRVVWRWGESYRHIHIMRVNAVSEMTGDCFIMQYVNTDSYLMQERVCPGTKIEIATSEFERMTHFYHEFTRYCLTHRKFCEEKLPDFKFTYF